MTNIPPKYIRTDNQNIYVPYHYFCIFLEKIIIAEKEIPEKYEPISYSVSYDHLLNEEFVYKWERYWNITFVKQAKNGLRTAIMASFLEDFLTLNNAYNKRVKLSFWQKIRITFANFLTTQKILNLIFWGGLIFKISSLTHNGNIHSKYITVGQVRRFLKLPAYADDE